MSKNKNFKIKNDGESLENKSKTILPMIGTSNKSGNKNSTINNTYNKNNFQNIEQVEIELRGKHPTSKSNIDHIKNTNNKSMIESKEERNIKQKEINRSNYKLIYSRNIGKGNKLMPNNKTHNKINNVEIINELKKSEIEHNKINQNIYKLIVVFRNEDFYISVKLNSLIKDLRLAISKLINLDISQISMVYEDKQIDISNDFKTVNEYFNLRKMRSRPIIYLKKKFVSNNTTIDGSSNFLFKKNYNNKVKITNFPSIYDVNVPLEENINKVINNFFKNNSSLGDETQSENGQYRIEGGNENTEDKKDNNTYIIGFSSPDLAFDFNRYLNSLKLINPIYKDIKSNIISMKKKSSDLKLKNGNNNSPKGNIRYGIDYNLDEINLTKRNDNILKLIRNNFLVRQQLKREKNNSQIYVNVSGPYLSSFDKERIKEKENKKKWINPKGFISCVGKYSGIQL